MNELRYTDRLQLSPAVFSILSGLIEEKLGIHYNLLDRELLQDKASGRALEAGFDSMLDYYYFLRYDPAGVKELDDLAESLVVNETYFFREWKAIEVLVHSFIKPLCAQGLRPRIWSAACSTGEEPLSLAMLLADLGILDSVDIVASDISMKALFRPQKNRYGKRSIRTTTPPKFIEKYLEPIGDEYRVSDTLINKIEWKQLNLLDEEKFFSMGKFDVVLCRNVLIYFSDSTIQKILERFHHTLNPQGLLLVGVSESLLRYGTKFHGEERDGTFIYKKEVLQ
jgi:chemotaxis protein methyltransferase CheR